MELDNVQTKKNSGTGGDFTGINLYLTPPFGQLTLEECEDLFRQRLEALHIIETVNQDTQTHLRAIKSFAFKTNCIALRENDRQQHRQDHLSHMLMRMYCVHNPNLWTWFKTNERKLLIYRLKDRIVSLSGNQLEDILNNFNFDSHRVIGSELTDLYKENLIGWNSREQHSFNKETLDIFRVKFTDALFFISKRSVALKDGYAYLTKSEIISIVGQAFERHLDGEFHYATGRLDTDHLQTAQLLESMHIVYLDHQEKIEEAKRDARMSSRQEGNNPYKIDMDSVDLIAKAHYPPCIRHLHDSLLQDHHLKHFGRIYYMTFLRAGGVDLDSNTDFWRKHFTKLISDAKFDRDYKYNIRHLYGKEGHKKALSSYSCEKIITSNPPGPVDKHGCPFKHFDESHLKTLLQKHGIKEVDIESIVMLKKNNEPTMACSHYFKALRGELPSEPIKNPIQFYYESVRLANRPPPNDDDNEDQIEGENVMAIDQETKNIPEQRDLTNIENAGEDFMDD